MLKPGTLWKFREYDGEASLSDQAASERWHSHFYKAGTPALADALIHWDVDDNKGQHAVAKLYGLGDQHGNCIAMRNSIYEYLDINSIMLFLGKHSVNVNDRPVSYCKFLIKDTSWVAITAAAKASLIRVDKQK